MIYKVEGHTHILWNSSSGASPHLRRKLLSVSLASNRLAWRHVPAAAVTTSSAKCSCSGLALNPSQHVRPPGSRCRSGCRDLMLRRTGPHLFARAICLLLRHLLTVRCHLVMNEPGAIRLAAFVGFVRHPSCIFDSLDGCSERRAQHLPQMASAGAQPCSTMVVGVLHVREHLFRDVLCLRSDLRCLPRRSTTRATTLQPTSWTSCLVSGRLFRVPISWQ